MKKTFLVICALLLSACSSAPTPVSATPTATPTRGPGAVALLSTPRPVPTALPAGQAVNYGGLSVAIQAVETDDAYQTEYGTTREAPVGLTFLWIQLSLENVDNKDVPLPSADHFSVLTHSLEFKPTYGHRADHPDYTSLPGVLFPRKPVQAWLRFDVPADVPTDDLRFAFLPESTQLTYLRSPNGASYYDHPVYLWRLESP